MELSPGVPTPDPALLIEIAGDDGSPTTLKWNLGEGVPTPDPANLVDNGSPTTLKVCVLLLHFTMVYHSIPHDDLFLFT